MKSPLPSTLPLDPISEASVIPSIEQDENILWAAHPDPEGYEAEGGSQELLKKAVYFIGPFALFLIATAIRESHSIISIIMMILSVAFTLVIAVVFRFFRKIEGRFTWKNVLYVVTNKRIIIQSAGDRANHVPVESIIAIEIEQEPKTHLADIIFHLDFTAYSRKSDNVFSQPSPFPQVVRPVLMKSLSRPEKCYFAVQAAKRRMKGNEKWQFQ